MVFSSVSRFRLVNLETKIFGKVTGYNNLLLMVNGRIILYPNHFPFPEMPATD